MKSEPLFENGFCYLPASDFDQTLSFNDSVQCNFPGLKFEQ